MGRWIPILVIAFSLSCSNLDERADSIGPTIGKLAPPIEGVDIHGTPFDLKDLRGSYVIIDFWGSWCGPCLQEAPKLVALHKEFAPKGVQIVSIALEKNNKNWRKAAEKLGFSWKHQLVEVSPFVRFNRIAADYEVTDIPTSFLIDPEGRVVLAEVHVDQIRQALTLYN